MGKKPYKTIGFIGAGNMGGALVRGLLSSGAYEPSSLMVTDPQQKALDTLEKEFPGIATSQNSDTVVKSDILILAVKPQIYPRVIASIAGKIRAETLVVTVAAGITLDAVAEWLGGKGKVIRTMPNTPALVGKGMTALCPGLNVTPEDIAIIRSIFDVVGQTIILPETLMDAFTALAGSSPAWVFMFIEALADGAVKEGLPRDSAYRIAAQAVLGSAQLVLESGEHPASLKDKVCSPGGTTIEGLATLEKHGLRTAVIQAVEDCTRKSRELGAK